MPSILAFDGGARTSVGVSAYAWCAWASSGKVIRCAATAVTPCATNNEMEAQALLSGLLWLRRYRPTARVSIIGDSAVIINLALGTVRVRSSNLTSMVARIREILCCFRAVTVTATSRTYNVAADALCNWIMDKRIADPHTTDFESPSWPLAIETSTDPIRKGTPDVLSLSVQDNDFMQWKSRWSLVLRDLDRIRHLIHNRFAAPRPSVTGGLGVKKTPPPTVDTLARFETSNFDTHILRSCTINGLERCVPLPVFKAFRDLATEYHLPFPVNRIFLISYQAAHFDAAGIRYTSPIRWRGLLRYVPGLNANKLTTLPEATYV
ncbi:hypothetical protein PHYSODRAFT_295468 [Phytophthora sojae]|uniref:RNase H type-1 domain-containing protein n=1 Tax=Phytophthora sojae (strain P6497) TaxID=1094619 RepID=G4YR76_PHYSP|nr:hypothetical protein PHYSODRAFT_295468 [Phytophthora sojae]EGZ22810.1 hypothetical protein PHYSODRAFT_295468 [Phytophthora sojae]|eukprot:XP_009518098.1 hypothetical protein PHYSODRAFT_295468 [Phytophthora sojae]